MNKAKGRPLRDSYLKVQLYRFKQPLTNKKPGWHYRDISMNYEQWLDMNSYKGNTDRRRPHWKKSHIFQKVNQFSY